MDDPKDQEGALLRATRSLMATTPIRALEVYKATGVSPSQQWAIKTGKTKAPSVNTVECLYRHLSGLALKV